MGKLSIVKVDDGKRQQKLKRGFTTKHEALDWEREFLMQKRCDPNMTSEMPDFLCDEMQEYISMLYDQKPDERIFPISTSYLHHEMDRGIKATGLKRIRIHDLRHSHVSLLIELGFSAVAIADRVRHESIEVTYRYAHLFPSNQTEMANKLGELKTGVNFNVNKES